jgi:mannose-6-phosphate isomerase-like protein (cupin superfamily)
MIVRNLDGKEAAATTYVAHGGAIARMMLTRRELEEIGFFACATLAPGKTIESHADPMEEIYFVVRGEGEMTVGDETRHVVPGDAIWLPAKVPHALANSGKEDLFILVVASPNY